MVPTEIIKRRIPGKGPGIKNMKIIVNNMAAAMNKAMAAVGKADVVKLQLATTARGKLFNICTYNDKGFQITINLSVGECTDEDAVVIVKASVLSALVKNYQLLGVDSIDLIFEETKVVLKDKAGEVTIAREQKMNSLSLEEAKNGPVGSVKMELKALANALKNTAGAIGAGTDNTNGYFFKASETGYEIYTTDSFTGAYSAVKAEAELVEGKKAEDLSFFAIPAIANAVAVLKGEVAAIAVTEKYLILRDAEGTFAIIAKSLSKFPVSAVSTLMVNRTADGVKPQMFTSLIKKDVLMAHINIGESLGGTEKGLTLNAVQAGETAELVCKFSNGSARTVEASTTVTGEGGQITLGFNKLRTCLAAAPDKTFIRVLVDGVLLFYGETGDKCLGFCLGAK